MKFINHILIMVIPALVGITFLSSCENDIEKVNFFIKDTIYPNQSGKQIEILYSEEAQVKIKVIASELERYADKDNPYIVFPSGIHVIFYSDSFRIESEMKADYAIYLENKKLWEARRNVEAVNIDGEVLNTELLFWNEEKEKIYSDKFVKITTKDEILYGDGFESNQNFTKYKIIKLKGIVNLKDEE